MANKLEDIKKRITSDLVRHGHFVNYIDGELLEKTIGKVLNIGSAEGETTEIKGILLSMKMRYFFPTKLLITFIELKGAQRMLLRIFLNTLREKFKISTNWRLILVPFKRKQDSLEIYNMAASFADLRFIDYCRTEEVKIIDGFMLSDEFHKPIDLPSNHQFCIKLVRKLLSPSNRNDYIESQTLMKDVISWNIKDENIRKTTIAQFLFSAVEAYDYYHTLDVVDLINPYYVFEKRLGRNINREKLRDYINFIFLKLMIQDDWKKNPNARRLLGQTLKKYELDNKLKVQYQAALEELLLISKFENCIDDLIRWKVFFNNEQLSRK